MSGRQPPDGDAGGRAQRFVVTLINMKNRPWPLVLLAALQALSPFFNVFFNAWALRVGPGQVMAWVLDQRPLAVFEFVALMPIAGVAIFMMKRWSYAVFCAAMGWSLISKIQHLSYAQGTLPWPALVAVYGLELALVTYFLLPAVRATYFDPRVRWWESKPRYELRLPATLETAARERLEASVMNLSEGGLFVRAARNLGLGSRIGVAFGILGQEFEAEGRVVHVREAAAPGASTGEGAYWHGIELAHTPATRARFRGLASALRDLGFQDRTPRESLFESFRAWMSNLIRTGKGLTPEVAPKDGARK